MSYTLFLVLILIVAAALILIVMVQNPKGGGLSSSLGGGSQSFGGVQNTNKFLDKATWTLAISLFALILLSNFAIPRNNERNDSQLEQTLEDAQTVPDQQNNVPVTTKDSVN